jgi:nucleoside 2-deoxyribosyltransferase
MSIVYIAGPVTGYENENREAFFSTERKLVAEGCRVINPARISDKVREKKPLATWPDFMREDLKYLLKCDSVYMLIGWKKSRGARIEHFLAKILEMKIVYQESEGK